MFDFNIIIQRLNDLSNWKNSVIANSKKISQLPIATAGIKKIAVHNESSLVTEQFNLTDALNGFNQLNDKITAYGTVSRDANVFTYSVGYEWILGGLNYANTTDIDVTVNDATDGFYRIDIVVVDTNNQIYLIEGFERDSVATQPEKPDDTLLLDIFNIFGDAIDLTPLPNVSEQVSNIQELRGNYGVYGQVIELLGYYTKGDKDSINYIYTSGSDFVDDGGSVIVPFGVSDGAWICIFKDDVSVDIFGANKDNDDNFNEIQKTINYCLDKNLESVSFSGKNYRINGTLSIPREIDGADTSNKFYLKNGGIIQTGNVETMRGDLTDNISSQLVAWQNMGFTSLNDTPLLYKNTMLRMSFESCSFIAQRFCDSYDYIQSIHFTDCNYRYWSGDFFGANNGCYDIHFKGGLAEHGENFINLNKEIDGFVKTERVNGVFVNNMCIEGLQGVGLLYTDSNLISVDNVYFEANSGGDIIFNSDDLQNTNYCVSINKCTHLLGASEPPPNHDREFYHVIYGSVLGGTCHGNFSTGNFSFMKSDYFTVELSGNRCQNGILTNKENCIGNIKVYHGDDLSPETLNYDIEVLKGATVYKRNYNPTASSIYGWICIRSGSYDTALWEELVSFTEQIDSNLLHKTGNETKTGSLTLRKDGSGAIPTHFVLSGSANPNLGLYFGVNTSTGKGQIQGYEDGVGFSTLQLQPTAGDVEIGGAGVGGIFTSPNGTKWRVFVSDLGILTTISV